MVGSLADKYNVGKRKLDNAPVPSKYTEKKLKTASPEKRPAEPLDEQSAKQSLVEPEPRKKKKKKKARAEIPRNH